MLRPPRRAAAGLQYRRSGLGRDRLDAGARVAHRAVLVDLARLFLRAVLWYAVQVHQTKFLLEIGFTPSVAAWALGSSA